MDEQPRLTDLVPRRLSTFLLVLLAGLAVIAGLEGLYAWMPQVSALASDGKVAAFDLDGEGSLAVWFSSMTLALAGLAAILVYMIRRHKTDDYRGHYRVWLWAALCWFVMSIDETSSLHEGFKEMMVVLTGDRVFGDGSIWWVAPYFFLLGAVGMRLLVDMRPSWLSSGALLTTAACYGLAVLAQLGWVLPESGARGVMVEEGAEMLGNLMLLLAMGLYARFVVLDAEGLLPKRERKKSDPLANAAGQNETPEMRAPAYRSVVVHPPQCVSRPAVPRTTAPSAHPAVSPTVDGGAPRASSSTSGTAPVGSPPRRKLSKAERKAMRKRLIEMKARREARLRGG
jgi:hypothetical protein